MLRKLIIAVFVLGFTLTLSGTALSDQLINEGQPRSVVNPQAPRAQETPVSDVALMADQLTPSQRLDGSLVQSVSPVTVTPQPPAAGCGYEFYHNGTATNYFTDPDYAGAPFSIVLNNVRFTVPEPQPGDGLGAIEDTVKGASLLCLTAPGYTIGTPGVRLYLYDDDGFGYPGNKLDSVDVDYATIVGNGDWADGTFPNEWVFTNGEEYHIAFSVLQTAASDTLAFLTDDGSGHAATSVPRNLMFLAGTGYNFWYAAQDLWSSGADFGIILESYVCRAEFPYSDCATQGWYGAPYYVWDLPNQGYGDEEYACRFDAVGQDTVVSVSFAISDLTGSVGAPYVFGDDDLILTLYGDDGTGLPDEGNVLFQTTITGGTYPAYPATVTVPVNIVVNDNFHMALYNASEVGITGDMEFVRGDGATGEAMDHTSSDWGGGFWVSMLNGWGGDYGFFYDAFICRDEYTECQAINYPEGNFDTVYPVPDSNPLTQWGQLYTGVTGLSCQLRDIEIGYYRSPQFDSARPNMYTNPTTIKVMTDAGGVPGSVVYSFDHTTTDYANAGYTGSNFYGAFSVKTDIVPPINPPSDFFVVVEPQTADRATGIRLQQYWGDGTPYGAPLGGLVSLFGVEGSGTEAWLQMPIFGGTFGTESMNATVTVCCIPIPRRPCAPGEDWFTLGHDFQRTYASENALGDAWCDLTVNWAGSDAWPGPARPCTTVICAFGDHYVQFDLATGAQNWTVGPIASLIGNGLRCSPTIVESVDLGTTVAFVSGGDQLAVAALDWATGAVLTQRDFIQDITDYGVSYGQTRWGNMMLVDNGGSEQLVWTTDDGWVRAASLTAPQMTINWQIQIGPTFESGATDGTNLYYCTWPATGDGDIYKIDAATGTITGTLSGGPDGLQGGVLYTLYATTTETFRSGVSLYNGKLYGLTDLAEGPAPGADFPADGVLYQIDPTTMGVDYAVGSVAGIRYAGIVHDIGRLYVAGISHWVAPANGSLVAHSRSNGVPVWGYEWPDRADYYVDGVLSCEGDGFDDLLFFQADNGFIGCWNSRTGEKLFHRRFDRSALVGANGAMAVDDLTGDVHLVYANQWGDLVDFTQSADRPRLQLTSFNFQQPVEFGSSTSIPLSLGPVVVNTGCTDLNVTDLLFDDSPSGTGIPAWSAKTVSDDMLTKSSNIADILTTDANKFKPFVAEPVPADNMVSIRDYNTSREIGNRAAAAFPGILNAPGYHATSPLPGVVAAGDTAEVILDVNQVLVQRGPNPFYMTLVSDDHDYFSQDGAVGTLGATDGTPPQVAITVIGGCLTDSTDLNFGIGGANFQIVSNSGRLADDVWGGADAARYGINIDAQGAAFFAGGYLYGVSQHRLAVNMHDVSGDDIDEFISWQPDPNWCDNECKPALEDNVNLGAISTDMGATYTPIIGNRVCASGIDSVQNFGDGLGGWDWTFGGSPQSAPFDNDSTIGLQVNSRTVGALDVPELERVAVEVFEFTERNGNDVPGWSFNVWIDTDAGITHGSGDTMIINRDYSVLWDTSPEDPGPAFGFIKIPYGCVANHDGTPLKNVWTLDTDNSMYSATRSYFDSAYHYSTLAPGEYSMPGALAARDQSLHGSLVEHDFTANETFTFGIGIFGYDDPLIAGNTDPNNAEVTGLADIVNKWAGFGRGDVNNDQAVNLADIIYLADYVNASGNGPYPFEHLGDVDADADVDADDVQYLIDFYFCQGQCPMGAWMF